MTTYLRNVAKCLYFDRSEHALSTCDKWVVQDYASGTVMCASQSLEGSYTVSCAFLDLRVVETLQGQRVCRFCKATGYVAANYGWLGGKLAGGEKGAKRMLVDNYLVTPLISRHRDECCVA